MKNLRGRTAVVIGATGGLGKAISISLVKKGCQVLLVGRSFPKLNEVVFEISQKTGIEPFQIQVNDFGKSSDWKIAAEQIEEKLGGVDFVINASGMDIRKSLLEQTDFEIDDQLNSNLKNAIYLTRAFLPIFMRQGQGEILHLSGFLDGRLAFPYYSVDVASRAGLVSFVESMNREIGNKKIRIATYCPTVADTESERPYHPIWQEMGQKILSPTKIAEKCIETLGSSNTLRISGGFPNYFFARLNSIFPGLADLILMNRYSKILQKFLNKEKNDQLDTAQTVKKSPFLYLGLMLITLSFLLYGGIVIVPFISLSTELKAGSITALVIMGELTFWVGLVLAGKTVYESMKSKLKSYFNFCKS